MPQEDPLIRILKDKPDILKLLGRIWDLLYVESTSPDVGIRRENVIKEMLREELGLEIASASSTERDWDFSIKTEEGERKYSLKTADLKTTENISIIKVAWNGFPSIERAMSFQFRYPILYIVRDREKKEISAYVFEKEDLEELKEKWKKDMWWIPNSKTNPRGFGIKPRAVKYLIDKAKKRGNFISVNYTPIEINDNIKARYLQGWYNLLKSLALML
jgi:hypothetical protein